MCRAKIYCKYKKTHPFRCVFLYVLMIYARQKSCCYYNVILALQMLIFKRFGLLS